MEFLNAVKESVFGTAKENESSNDAVMNQNDNSSDNSSSISLTPSLFSRNQPDPESSAHGDVKDKLHSDTIAHWEPVSRDASEKPEVKPINTGGHSALPSARDQMSNESSVPSSAESGSAWMDKLGSIMGGNNKDEAQSFWRTSDTQDKQDDRSVMDKLRDAHMEATPEKGMTDTIKEKFDNWSQSASNMMSGNSSNDRGMTENMQEKMSDMKDAAQDRAVDMKDSVQEKVGDMKNQVDSMWNKSGSVEALPDSSLPIVKHDATADIPDPNFIQNA